MDVIFTKICCIHNLIGGDHVNCSHDIKHFGDIWISIIRTMDIQNYLWITINDFWISKIVQEYSISINQSWISIIHLWISIIHLWISIN